MKTKLAIAATLFLATRAAHASAHLTFLECGPYSIVNIWAAPTGGDFDKWYLILDRDRGWNESSNRKRFPGRMMKYKHQTNYYRGLKCQIISRAAVKETESLKVPPWTENKDPSPWDHIQPPKGDGWEDIEK
jgi:hypothetical protein